MNIKPLNDHHLELLGLKIGCTGSSESTLVKMTHCWKSHVTAQYISSNLPRWALIALYLYISTTVSNLMFMLFRFSPKEPIVLVSVQQTEVVVQDEGEVHIEVIVQVDIHLE